MKPAATVALLGVLAIIGVVSLSKMLLVQSYLGDLGSARLRARAARAAQNSHVTLY